MVKENKVQCKHLYIYICAYMTPAPKNNGIKKKCSAAVPTNEKCLRLFMRYKGFFDCGFIQKLVTLKKSSVCDG